MIEDGLVNEVRSLRKYKNLNALNTVGYKEIFDFLDNKINLDEAIELIKINTKKYSKRQMTWFKKYKNVIWIDENYKDDQVINKLKKSII